MKFWCMKQSLSCPSNLIGHPDCENCEYYGKCRYCGKIGTLACKQCEANEKEQSDAEK